MLCLNCGRRSSDTKNFCEYCGAMASEEVPSVPAPPVPQPSRRSAQPSRPQARPTPQPETTVRRSAPRPARSGSNPIGTLIFWGLVFYGLYWFMSDDGRDFRTLVNDVIQQQRQQQETPASQPIPSPVPRAPATEPAPAATGRPVPGAAPVERSAAPTPAPASPAELAIEGLSPAQVIQRLGRPSSVVTLNGVTGWSYRDGALVVYFVKDRATLKPPR